MLEEKLGDLIESISEKYDVKKDKVILINTSDVLEGKIINHKYVENKNLKGQFKKSFRKNDILYSEIRPQNKRFAYVDIESDDYVASTKLMVLRTKNNNVYSEYIFQFLKTPKVIEELQSLAETRSGTFPQITFNEIANLKINLPEKTQQKKVVSILESIDKKIEINNKINHNLENQII
jgi:type I restriction enzyme S subunit